LIMRRLQVLDDVEASKVDIEMFSAVSSKAGWIYC
jgi:hypothetical protein